MPVPRVKAVIAYATAADQMRGEQVEAHHLEGMLPSQVYGNLGIPEDGLAVRLRDVGFTNTANASTVYERLRAFVRNPDALPPGLLPPGATLSRVRGSVTFCLCSHTDPVVVSCRDDPSSAFVETLIG